MSGPGRIDRRSVLAAAAGAAAAAAAGEARAAPNPICAFVKPIQALSYDRLAEALAGLGFNGIEATVRRGGQVLPERVEQDLPKLAAAMKGQGLEVTLMATNISRADDPLARKVLRAAADLGIRRYRTDWYRYDLSRPVLPQLDAFRPAAAGLAALNRELGLTGLYQNHAGAAFVGASLWDLHALLRDLPPSDLGAAFDIRHAVLEGGLSWPVRWSLLRPHVGALFVKDFRWEGRRVENVPLGQGQVDPAFFKLVREAAFAGPISIHVEYLEQSGVPENLAAFRADLRTLRDWLAA